MKKENLKFIFISVLFFVVLFSLILFFGILPLWKAIKSEEMNYKRVEFKIKDLEEKRRKIIEYKQRERDLESNGELIKKAVLRKGEEVDFVKELEQIAQMTGVKLEIKNYIPPNKKNNVDSETGEKVQDETIEEARKRQEEEKKIEYFQLLLEGEYPQILDFVYKLENMGKSFVIKSLDISNLFETKSEIEATLRQKQTPNKFALKGEIVISFNWQ